MHTCTKCKYHYHDVFHDALLCTLNPKIYKIDPTNGQALYTNGRMDSAFYHHEQFERCREINIDGKCKEFEQQSWVSWFKSWFKKVDS